MAGNMKKHRIFMLLGYSFFFGILTSGAQSDGETRRWLDENFAFAAAQYALLAKHVPDSLFPKTWYPDKGLESFPSWWWCSGFYPGTLLYLHGEVDSPGLYQEALRKLAVLEKEKNNTRTHDLGFMMYCSFGNAQKIAFTKANEEILLRSARSLASRFSATTGCIRSWNSKKDGEFLVIIDNMMNLELLFHATRVSGDSSFHKIALSHADKTMVHHFRDDYSSYHVVEYDSRTGQAYRKRTQQGAHDGSAWARGQAWGLYGYTVMYRETRNHKYLDLADHIADFLLGHPRLPGNLIPYWDFDAPDIPQAPRDASAAAIIASALLELATYSAPEKARSYLKAAESMLRSLSGVEYRAAMGTNGGFLLKHSVGSLPEQSEVDVPLSYADYYFIEAMVRYRRLAIGENSVHSLKSVNGVKKTREIIWKKEEIF